MSERDGLAKLSAYLQQTRRQAEQSIDVLNTKILQLENESEAIASERDYFRNYSEQLKLENSKKWRLQERDDWKSLVDSVQIDRGRLQDNCTRLEGELEEARAGVKILEEEINLIMNNDSQIIEEGDFEGAQFSEECSIAGESSSFMNSPRITESSFQTPIKASSSEIGDDVINRETRRSSAPTPRTVALKLQVELQRALRKLESERIIFAEEKASNEKRISELEEEINRFKKTSPGSNRSQINQNNNKTQQISATSSASSLSLSTRKDPFSLLYSVPQNFFSFLFSTNNISFQAPVVNV